LWGSFLQQNGPIYPRIYSITNSKLGSTRRCKWQPSKVLTRQIEVLVTAPIQRAPMANNFRLVLWCYDWDGFISRGVNPLPQLTYNTSATLLRVIKQWKWEFLCMGYFSLYVNGFNMIPLYPKFICIGRHFYLKKISSSNIFVKSWPKISQKVWVCNFYNNCWFQTIL
jgi:hypothetical protein